MSGLKVKLTGFGELKKKLERAAKEVPHEVDAELSISAEDMRAGAIRDAPADQGLLRAEIQKTKVSFLNYGTFSNALYSGYLEFGTKSEVSIPAGLEEVANDLRGKTSSSLDVKEAIFNWCKRKGIEERLWYPIFIKIMVKGIKPHPYFFKQLDRATKPLLDNIENILKQI